MKTPLTTALLFAALLPAGAALAQPGATAETRATSAKTERVSMILANEIEATAPAVLPRTHGVIVAAGDGTTDDRAAFAAADAAANGRTVLVSAGTYRLASDFTFSNAVRFEGTASLRHPPHP